MFCVFSGVIQPAVGIVFSGILGVITVPLEFVWKVADLDKAPTDPLWAITYTKEQI